MILQKLFSRRGAFLGVDDPASDLLNPAAWLISALSGEDGSITAKQAARNSNVYACVSILADDIAKLPIHTFTVDGGRDEGQKHPAARLLYERANPLMSAFTFKQTLQAHLGLYGNAYALIAWRSSGYPDALWVLDPSVTVPRLDIATGQLTYHTHDRAGRQYILQPSDVLHLRTMTLNGIVGVPPWKTLVPELDGQKATKEFIRNFYKNGTHVSGVLQADTKIDAEAKNKLRGEWNKIYGTPENAGKVAVLDMGLDYKPLGMQLDQAQFIETQKFGINEVAKVYRVPPHKLAQLDRATYANAEAMGLDYIKTTLLPIFTQWEQEINYKLFTEEERAKYYVKFNAAAELRGDSAMRAQYYKQMLETGVYTINEVRAMEEQLAIGENGDKHFVSLNYTTLDNLEALQLAKAGSARLKGGEEDGSTERAADADDGA